MSTVVHIPSFTDSLEPLLKGIESIQRDVLHNRWRGELDRLLSGRDTEKATMEQGQPLVADASKLLSGEIPSDIGWDTQNNQAMTTTPRQELNPEQLNELNTKYAEKTDVASGSYPPEFYRNPFRQKGFSFDEQMKLRAANRSQKEPTVYYNPTTKKRGNANWAMGQQNEGYEVVPLAKTDITTIPNKQANVAINETKLMQNYFDNPTAASAAPLSEYLGKQGKEGITPLDRTKYEKMVDWWQGTEPPTLIIKDKKTQQIIGFNQYNQEIPMTNPPKQTQSKNTYEVGKRYRGENNTSAVYHGTDKNGKAIWKDK
jgi:hypothetical protein